MTAGLAFTPVAIAAAEAARQAATVARFAAEWPLGPREHLRKAHAELRAAENELARHREHAAAAATHRGECDDAVEHAKEAVDVIRRRETESLRGRLAGAIATANRNDEASEIEAMAAAEKARRAQAVALSVESEITISVSDAEAAARSCRTAVERAARAVCAEAYREIRVELAAVEDRVEKLRRRSGDLAAVGDYRRRGGSPTFGRCSMTPKRVSSRSKPKRHKRTGRARRGGRTRPGTLQPWQLATALALHRGRGSRQHVCNHRSFGFRFRPEDQRGHRRVGRQRCRLAAEAGVSGQPPRTGNQRAGEEVATVGEAAAAGADHARPSYDRRRCLNRRAGKDHAQAIARSA